MERKQFDIFSFLFFCKKKVFITQLYQASSILAFDFYGPIISRRVFQFSLNVFIVLSYGNLVTYMSDRKSLKSVRQIR